LQLLYTQFGPDLLTKIPNFRLLLSYGYFANKLILNGFWVVPAFPVSFSHSRCLVAVKMKMRKKTDYFNLYAVSSFCFRENGKSNVEG
jgi:hypothetical protein